MLTRRQFIKSSGAAGFGLAIAPSIAADAKSSSPGIDRAAVVRRHNPLVTKFDPFSALSLGNGQFAFTADCTGLQTFSTECSRDFPLCTASHWGWHTIPAPGLRREDFRYKDYDTYGRPVGYATDAKGQEPLFNWLRQNPHRLHLGRIGLEFGSSRSRLAGEALKEKSEKDQSLLASAATKPDDLRNIRQTLDLWSGLLESRFEFEGKPVLVQTCCHPGLDLLAVRVESSLLATGNLR